MVCVWVFMANIACSRLLKNTSKAVVMCDNIPSSTCTSLVVWHCKEMTSIIMEWWESAFKVHTAVPSLCWDFLGLTVLARGKCFSAAEMYS